MLWSGFLCAVVVLVNSSDDGNVFGFSCILKRGKWCFALLGS